MAKIKVHWRKVSSHETIRRSSQVIGVSSSSNYGPLLCIFGGELKPREPVDNETYVLCLDKRKKELENLNPPTNANVLPASLPAVMDTKTSNPKPSPRVGSAAASFNNHTYLFSGRGGQAMTPIDEYGSTWALSHLSNQWVLIEPANSAAPVPPARSYHSLTSDKRDTLYLHAGCPEKGRLSDLWAFQLSCKRWIKLCDASNPPRGGTSITFCPDVERLYRMNGFDGRTEQGGSVDIYNPETDAWSSRTYEPDGKEGPEARSVSALLCLKLSEQPFLVTLFGERDPSSLGHAGAGKMLGDVWAWDVRGESWTKVESVEEETPEPRGWFAADVIGDEKIVVHGGLNEANERLGDVWIGSFELV